MVSVVTWTCDEIGIEMTIGSLMRALNCSCCAVQSELANALDEPKSCGRHLAVSGEFNANTLVCITKETQKNAAGARTDIKNYCREVCKFEVGAWMGGLIRVFLDQTGRSMHEVVQTFSPIECLIVMKLGYPTGRAHVIHHRISRRAKHRSVVTCIFTGDACITPCMVTSQNSVAIQRALEAGRMQIRRRLILKNRRKPYVSDKLFEDYLRTVFLSHLMITRIMQTFRKEDSVLLMENCSPYPACPRTSPNFPCASRYFRTAYHTNLPSSRSDSVLGSEKR
jgi:hypothetical protein